MSTIEKSSVATPSVRLGLSQAGQRIAQSIQDVFTPAAVGSGKGAALGLLAVGSGLAFAANPAVGLILGGSAGMVLGATVPKHPVLAWDPYRSRWYESVPLPGCRLLWSVVGGAAGVGLAATGWQFPVSTTLLAAGVAGAAIGYAFKKVFA